MNNIIRIKIFASVLLLFSCINYAQGYKAGNDSLIIILGDSQRTGLWEFWRERNTGVARQIFDKIAEENPAAVIHMGDLVFDGSSEYSWSCFESDASELLSKKIPLFPVMGNHEYFGKNKKAMENFHFHFPFLRTSAWYIKRFDDLAVIFLNSNFDDLSEKENRKQLRWYKKMLKEINADTAVKALAVICHHPPFTNGRMLNGSKKVEESFAAPFMKSPKAAFFFSGHIHSYEHFIKEGRHFIVSGGGGGPRREVETRPQKVKHRDMYTGGSMRDFHYIRLIQSKSTIRLEVIGLGNENPSIIDSIIFNKFTTGQPKLRSSP